MKNLIFSLLFVPMLGFGQFKETNLISLWDKYLKDCNELVADTITQTGTVNCDYKPVLINGKVDHLVPVPVDTAWNIAECKPYKIDEDGIRWGNIYGGSISAPVWNDLSRTLCVGYTSPTSSIAYSEPKMEQRTTFVITRLKYCMIKKRKASWDDFWIRWLKENRVIEFN